jgi:hypothetical protein
MEVSDEPQQPLEPYASQPVGPTPQQDEPRQYRDLSRYSLTAEAATELFRQAGVPRALRSVIRYCSNQTLDCIKVDTERNLKYLVTPESVDARIVELKQIAAIGHDALRRDTAGHSETIDAPWQDATSHGALRGENKKIEELENRVGELARENEQQKNKIRDLEFLHEVKDQVLKKNESTLEKARREINRFNRAVGELATMLRLKAPKEDTSQIIASLDAPTEATDQEPEDFIDALNSPR